MESFIDHNPLRRKTPREVKKNHLGVLEIFRHFLATVPIETAKEMQPILAIVTKGGEQISRVRALLGERQRRQH